jgi:hypothetical protein
MMRRPARRHGFATPWILPLAASVIFLLSAILVPALSQERGSRIDHSGENLYWLAFALKAYADDHDGYLPPMHDAAALRYALAEYARVTESPSHRRLFIFANPETQEVYLPNAALSGRKWSEIEARAASIIAFREVRADQHGRRRTVTLDGRVHYFHDW